MALTTAQIQQAYVTFFSRPADPAGLSYWSSYAGSVADLYATFAKSTEYSAAFTGLSSAQQVNVVYQNLFGRDAEAAGLLYWAKQIDAGAITVANLALAVSAGAQTTDAAVVANRVTAATAFTTAVDTTAEILGYSGAAANAAAKTWLSAVKDTAATLTTATAGVDAAVAGTVAVGGASGSTFTLTTGVDSLTGTSGNDTFVGGLTVEGTNGTISAATYNVTDTLAGGAGADVLNLTVDGALKSNTATALTTATITGVETVNIRAAATMSGTSSVTVDASQFAGATAIVSDRSVDTLTVTNLASGAAAGVNGNGSAANAASSFDYVAAAKAATLNISNGTTAGAITLGAGTGTFTTATINSTGAANTVGAITINGVSATAVTINAGSSLVTGGLTDTDGTITTVTVAGGAANAATGTKVAVDLGALTAAVTTVDASGLSNGGVAATLVAAVKSFKGGAGNDTVTTASATLTSATAVVDAGAGTDTLVVATNADIATLAEAAKYQNFETLQVGAFTQDASLVSGITAIKLGGAASSATNLNAVQAANITVTASDAGGTVTLKDASGTTDVVSITASNTTAGVDLTNFIVTNVETLNFTNSSNAANTLSFDGVAATPTGKGLKAITVAGAKGVTLDLAAQNTPAHTATLTSIDASGLTAQTTGTNTFTLKDTVGGHALKNGLVVTGSAGEDAVSLGATTGTDTLATGVVVTVNAGAGADNVTVSAAQLYTAGAGYLVIDGGAGTDTLTIADTALGTLSDSAFAHVTNVEKIALGNTGVASITTGGFFNTAFAGGSVTVTNTAHTSNAFTWDSSLYTGSVTITDTAATTGADTITTGAGADTVTVTTTAAVAANGVVINTGAGNDTIKVTGTGTLANDGVFVLTGGTGQDKITLAYTDASAAKTAATFVVAAGDSNIGAADQITGFYVAGATRKTDAIDFAGSAVKPATAIAATAVTGETLASLQFTVTTAGLLAFTGTKAAALTSAQVENIWTTQLSTLLNNLETVVWANANSADTGHNGNSFVFNHNTTGDSVVELVGVQATAVGASAATANLVGIA